MIDALDGGGSVAPADLQANASAAKTAAALNSKDSYSITIEGLPVKSTDYVFTFNYYYQNPDSEQGQPILGPSSAAFKTKLALTDDSEYPQNASFTAGPFSYTVKWDMPTSAFKSYGDTIVYESYTQDFASSTVVYNGSSNQFTHVTPNLTARYVKILFRSIFKLDNPSTFADKFVILGPITPKNSDPDTTTAPAGMTSTSATAVIDPNDKSGFGAMPTITWTASTDTKTQGYAIRWSTDNPATVTNPMWEYNNVDGINTTTFTVTGLTPNVTYYYQVAPKSAFNAIDWNNKVSGTFSATDNTAGGAWSRLKSYIAIGGATEDLFKIGTQIVQKVNNSTTTTPTYTADTTINNGIILNKSTTNVGNNYWLNSGQFRVGNETSFLYWNGSDIYTTGKINATGGTIVGNLQIAVPLGATTSGVLYAGASPDSGNRLRLSDQGLFAYINGDSNPTFGVTVSTGYVTARLGVIGGWNLSDTTLSNNNATIDSSGSIVLGSSSLGEIVKLSSTDAAYRLWVGNNSGSQAKFAVEKDGTMHATNGYFSGTLTVGSQLSDGTSLQLVKDSAASGAALVPTVSSHTNTLADHTGTLSSHTNTLSDHTQTLASHTQTLADQAATLSLAVTSSNVNTVLAANTTVINGSRITTGTVDLAYLNIAGGSPTANGFKIDSTGIRAYNGYSRTIEINSNGTVNIGDDTYGWTVDNRYITSRSYYATGYSQIILDGWNGQISGGRISGTIIDGATVIGGVVKTSGNTERVELNGTTGSLRAIYSSSVRGHILAAAGTTGTGIIMHAGSTANSNATTYGLFYAAPSYVLMAGSSTTYIEATSTQTNIRGGNNGIYLLDSTYLQSGDTETTSSANVYANSTNGRLYRYTSSQRYKTNIETITFTDEVFKKIRPVKFQGIKELEDGNKRYGFGFIAEEIASIPELDSLVQYNEQGQPESLNYDRFTSIIVDVVQRILNRLDALEA
jgi:hypothetical protein